MCNRRTCLECNAALAGRDDRAEFCGTPCRKTWNNRRAVRGAELYDLFMAYRYDRSTAKLLGLWSLICRMASVWKREDDNAGRRSYGKPQAVKDRALRYQATVVHRGR